MSRLSARPAPPSPRRTQRRALLELRAALPLAARRSAERRITLHAARLAGLSAGRSVALYVSRGPEVDTAPLRALAALRGCRVCLPKIIDYPGRRMEFVAARGHGWRLNRYRIAEPAGGAVVPLASLSLVFLPLAGFDAEGNRLGSGAGFYDRALAARRGRGAPPLLVGLGFDCQRCAAIAAAPHDVPLDAVVTESGLHYFPRG